LPIWHRLKRHVDATSIGALQRQQMAIARAVGVARRRCRASCQPARIAVLATSIVTGQARYTMDVAVDGLLYIKVLRSPHAHARIVEIDRAKALAVAEW